MDRGRTRSVFHRMWALVLAGLLALPAPLLAAQPAIASATTFTVNTAEDSDDGAWDPLPAGDCTLREAIMAANANAGKDTIAFAIPGEGVQTIKPTSQFPSLLDPVIIDGYTQPGAQPNTAAVGTNAVLNIELDGSDLPTGGIGLADGGGEGSVIRGLVITNFTTGIVVAARFSDDATVIEGNFVGTDPSGTTAKPNNDGVVINTATFEPPQVRIGGSDLGTRNLISGNGNGITLRRVDYAVIGNLIGVDRSGVTPLGNALGLELTHGGGVVAGNVIAFNTTTGVSLPSDAERGHEITRNAIFGNGGLGIDLGADGPTANDPGDADTGPNNLQNFPVLTAATSVGGVTTVTGSLNSQPNGEYVIQYFANPDAAGVEGKTFLGQQEVDTDGNGFATLAFAIDQPLAGQAITTTATDVTTNLPADTSEFSAPVTVPRPTQPAPPPQAGQGDSSQDDQSESRSKKKKEKKGKRGKKGKKGRKNRNRLAAQTSETTAVDGKSHHARGKGGTRTQHTRHGRDARGNR